MLAVPQAPDSAQHQHFGAGNSGCRQRAGSCQAQLPDLCEHRVWMGPGLFLGSRGGGEASRLRRHRDRKRLGATNRAELSTGSHR